MIKVKQANRKGFTLIEILVVLGVTTLLTGIVLTYGSQGRNQTTLYVEQAKLAQVLIRAKSLSVATYFKTSGDVPCGYGVRINSGEKIGSYELFSYRPIDCFAIKNTGVVASEFSQDYKVIEKYSLAPGVRFSEEDSKAPLSVVFFSPPNPDTYIWIRGNEAVSPNPGYVNLTSVDGSLTMTVQITAGGQVGY